MRDLIRSDKKMTKGGSIFKMNVL